MISVVIPTFNHSRYVSTAINSVLNQKDVDIELVVVDDGSTDGSPDIITKHLAKHPSRNARLIIQENKGAHAAIMRGIDESNGELISILNSDDYFADDRFQRMLETTTNQPDFIAFTKVSFVDENNTLLPRSNAWPQWYAKALTAIDDNPTVGFALMVHNFSVTSGNFFFTRSLYHKVGGFSTHKLLHDWDFLLRCIYYVEPVFVPEELLFYRVHGDNTTEKVRPLLLKESKDALARYFSLSKNVAPPNSNAPCVDHWPYFFPLFKEGRKAAFGGGVLGDYFPLEH